MIELVLFPLDEQFTAYLITVGVSEYAQGELGPSRSHQPSKPDNLPLFHLEIHVCKYCFSQRWGIGVPVSDFQHYFLKSAAFSLRINVVDFPANHVLY